MKAHHTLTSRLFTLAVSVVFCWFGSTACPGGGGEALDRIYVDPLPEPPVVNQSVSDLTNPVPMPPTRSMPDALAMVSTNGMDISMVSLALSATADANKTKSTPTKDSAPLSKKKYSKSSDAAKFKALPVSASDALWIVGVTPFGEAVVANATYTNVWLLHGSDDPVLVYNDKFTRALYDGKTDSLVIWKSGTLIQRTADGKQKALVSNVTNVNLVYDGVVTYTVSSGSDIPVDTSAANSVGGMAMGGVGTDAAGGTGGPAGLSVGQSVSIAKNVAVAGLPSSALGATAAQPYELMSLSLVDGSKKALFPTSMKLCGISMFERVLMAGRTNDKGDPETIIYNPATPDKPWVIPGKSVSCGSADGNKVNGTAFGDFLPFTVDNTLKQLNLKTNEITTVADLPAHSYLNRVFAKDGDKYLVWINTNPSEGSAVIPKLAWLGGSDPVVMFSAPTSVSGITDVRYLSDSKRIMVKSDDSLQLLSSDGKILTTLQSKPLGICAMWQNCDNNHTPVYPLVAVAISGKASVANLATLDDTTPTFDPLDLGLNSSAVLYAVDGAFKARTTPVVAEMKTAPTTALGGMAAGGSGGATDTPPKDTPPKGGGGTVNPKMDVKTVGNTINVTVTVPEDSYTQVTILCSPTAGYTMNDGVSYKGDKSYSAYIDKPHTILIGRKTVIGFPNNPYTPTCKITAGKADPITIKVLAPASAPVCDPAQCDSKQCGTDGKCIAEVVAPSIQNPEQPVIVVTPTTTGTDVAVTVVDEATAILTCPNATKQVLFLANDDNVYTDKPGDTPYSIPVDKSFSMPIHVGTTLISLRSDSQATVGSDCTITVKYSKFNVSKEDDFKVPILPCDKSATCNGTTCGSDGCGGVCGCKLGLICNPSKQCVTAEPPPPAKVIITNVPTQTINVDHLMSWQSSNQITIAGGEGVVGVEMTCANNRVKLSGSPAFDPAKSPQDNYAFLPVINVSISTPSITSFNTTCTIAATGRNGQTASVILPVTVH